ncbi:MAG: hypothetical protein M3023_02220 [Pseudomonadota bacterium]|nr:hypothetical protein [Pseudomonadota bacterium]
MKRKSTQAIFGVVAAGALLGGCATTVEMGPGYYHYDIGVARPSAPAVVYREPAVTYQPPAVTTYQAPVVTYREPAVVYREPAVVYSEPAIVYRDSPFVYRDPMADYRKARDAALYRDHGQ